MLLGDIKYLKEFILDKESLSLREDSSSLKLGRYFNYKVSEVQTWLFDPLTLQLTLAVTCHTVGFCSRKHCVHRQSNGVAY